ncbi:zinc finger MYM-type protein 1-like [Setaria italica]|uniref:zinc finger MYM-type protein 1-like n=1 Tax=Setaria italica TaxID=4555 RepID=UPI000BE503AA|nr:zinc finger MYM-type protein 1-like [Setaria italica]
MEMLEWYRKKDPKAALVTGENAPGNNQMSSPMVQKDLARACAEETSELIKSEIGDRCFAVLVDEARDASIKEQMAVVVRFVNDKGSVIERFLGIEHVADTTSTSLKEALDTMLRRYGLSISKIRGQGYDGASNMRGQFHGLQRLVLNENPYAFYIHCFAHQLQLVVVSVAKCCGSTFDFFNYVTSIVNVVSASCKRKDQLLQSHHDKLVEQLDSSAIFSGRGKNQETSLARPGDTRWGTHHKTLARLMIMWSSVLEVLENISEDGTDGEKKLQPLD